MLAEEAMIAFEDHFDDSEELRKFVFEQIKQLAKGAKLIRMNKSFTGVIESEDNKRKQEIFYLKDVNLDHYSIDSDPAWLPKNIQKNDVKFYILKVGEKTWGALQLFSKVNVARAVLYNKSLDKSDENYDGKLMEKPKCFEQIIQENLILAVYEKIGKNIDDELEKEDAELNKPKKKEEKKKKKKK